MCAVPTRRSRRSAGILLHRQRDGALEVLLVHPGGPAWAQRDLGAWSIPKGEYEARRGSARGGATRVRGGARVTAAGRRDRRPRRGPAEVRQAGPGLGDARRPRRVERSRATRVPFQWPPRSGKWIEIPEVDRARVVRPRRGPGQDQRRPGGLARPARRRRERRTVSPSEAISPTAHYTGYVWARNGLSHPALSTL